MLFAASPIRKAAYRTLKHVIPPPAGAIEATRTTKNPGNTNAVPIDAPSTAYANSPYAHFVPPSTAPLIRKAVLQDPQHVKPTGATATPHSPPSLPPKPLLTHYYEPHPQPLNCTTYASTRLIATERDHPLHLRTQRRLAQSNPTILHWAVHVPVEVNKKAIVRSWVKRRVREAFQAELEAQGWDIEGRVMDAREGEPLRGALCLRVGGQGAQGVIRATGEEVRRECGVVLGKVVGAMRWKARASVDKGEERRRLWKREREGYGDPGKGFEKVGQEGRSKHLKAIRSAKRGRSGELLNPRVDRPQREGYQMWS